MAAAGLMMLSASPLARQQPAAVAGRVEIDLRPWGNA